MPDLSREFEWLNNRAQAPLLERVAATSIIDETGINEKGPAISREAFSFFSSADADV